jgi:hypothetical protein
VFASGVGVLLVRFNRWFSTYFYTVSFKISQARSGELTVFNFGPGYCRQFTHYRFGCCLDFSGDTDRAAYYRHPVGQPRPMKI